MFIGLILLHVQILSLMGSLVLNSLCVRKEEEGKQSPTSTLYKKLVSFIYGLLHILPRWKNQLEVGLGLILGPILKIFD